MSGGGGEGGKLPSVDHDPLNEWGRDKNVEKKKQNLFTKKSTEKLTFTTTTKNRKQCKNNYFQLFMSNPVET